MKNYKVRDVAERLNKKSSCFVSADSRTIRIYSNHDDLGIGSWGQIDFLVNHCGFSLRRAAASVSP